MLSRAANPLRAAAAPLSSIAGATGGRGVPPHAAGGDPVGTRGKGGEGGGGHDGDPSLLHKVRACVWHWRRRVREGGDKPGMEAARAAGATARLTPPAPLTPPSKVKGKVKKAVGEARGPGLGALERRRAASAETRGTRHHPSPSLS